MTESLCCTPETNTTLLINISIKILKNKKNKAVMLYKILLPNQSTSSGAPNEDMEIKFWLQITEFMVISPPSILLLGWLLSMVIIFHINPFQISYPTGSLFKTKILALFHTQLRKIIFL